MELACREMKIIHNGMRRFGKVLLNSKRPYCNKRPAVILGIETSCDDTGCAVVDSDGNVLGEALHSQQQMHLKYNVDRLRRYRSTPSSGDAQREYNGGLRKSLEIRQHETPRHRRCGNDRQTWPGAFSDDRHGFRKISVQSRQETFHTDSSHGGARSHREDGGEDQVDYPFLVLLISGGHCLLAVVKDVATFYLLGKTIDNAPGEILDKAARRLKLKNLPDYSCLNGGAAIELAASRATNPLQFEFDLPIASYRDCNFSFAGLRNKVVRYAIGLEREHNIIGDAVVPHLNNLCAGFQMAVAKHLAHRTRRAIDFCIARDLIPFENQTLVVSGGVACNNFIAKALKVVCDETDWRLVRPPPNLCTDNGIMIAWNGVERWIADEGVIRDPEKIEQIDIENKAPFGEDWISKVVEERIRARTIRTKQLYDSS